MLDRSSENHYHFCNMAATRTLSFRLYPSPRQGEVMVRKHGLLRDLWNAALDERIAAFRKGVRISRSDQEKALKVIGAELPGWRGLVHTHEAQVVLKRLDLAFQGFFRRLKAGAKPGFPRFKSAERFPGWGYKEHGNGFRVEMRDGWRHGHVTLSGIGRMRLRGLARTPGRICKADVIRDSFGWRLSVVAETDCAQRAPANGPAAGLDWGVSTFATLALEDGRFAEVENPRHLDAEAERLRERQRGLSALARSRKISRRALGKARRALARAHAKVAARRKDFLHKLTARLAATHPLIATEALTVKNMTASARGTLEAPGRNVAQKTGLNRSILDTAPAAFLNMLRYKAEEAGSEYLTANTRRLKPSQRCPGCGTIRKKDLSDRQHDCSCGCRLERDRASSLVLLTWGLEEKEARASAQPGNGHPAGTVGGLCG
jgi:putative transposase